MLEVMTLAVVALGVLCFSAAKWKTAEQPSIREAHSFTDISEISASTRRTLPARRVQSPVRVSSTPTTSHSRSLSSRFDKWDPMKPAAPVTKTRLFPSEVGAWLLLVCMP